MLLLRPVFIALLTIGAAILIAFVSLVLVQFHQIRSDLERERIAVLAERIAEPFEAAARIGLPLSSVRNAPVLLERARQTDSAIKAVFLLDGRGVVLGAGPAAEAAAASRAFQAAEAERTEIFQAAPASFLSGVRILDSDSRPVGGVMLSYSVRQNWTGFWAMAGQLLLAGILLLLAATPLLWFLLRLALRRPIRECDRIESDIHAFERAAWRVREERAPDSAQGPGMSTLGALLAAADERYRLAMSGGSRTGGRPEAPPLAPMQEIGALRGRIVMVMGGVIAAMLMAFSAFTMNAFERAITPELESRSALMGSLIRSEMQRALELGIPMNALGGLEPYLDGVLRDFGEIDVVSIVDRSGQVITVASRDAGPAAGEGAARELSGGDSSRRSEFAVLVGNEVVGTIRIEISGNYVQTRLRNVVLDVSLLALAILLIGVEVAIAAVTAAIWKPLERILRLLNEQVAGRFSHVIRVSGPMTFRRLAARLNDHAEQVWARLSPGGGPGADPRPTALRLSEPGDVRLPLFLFAFGSEITASFLPVLAADLPRPPWVSAAAAAAAPLVLYLVFVALLSPFAGVLSRLFGARRLFLFAVPPTMGALLWMAAAPDLVQVALARGVVAAFYALATIAAQEYALRSDGRIATSRVMSVFVGQILGGTFCGTVVGGVMAGEFGYGPAIVSGSVFVLAAGVAAFHFMRGVEGEPVRLAPLAAKVAGESADRLRFVALLAGVALPMTAVTAAFIWYATPLSLSAEGHAPSDIARVVMAYYLAAILLGPAVGRLSAGPRASAAALLAGVALSGTALLALSVASGYLAWVVVVALVGVGHALIRAPAYALAVRLAGSDTGLISLLRLLERLAAIAGLVFAATAKAVGQLSAIAPALGVVVWIGAAVLVLLAIPGQRPLTVQK